MGWKRWSLVAVLIGGGILLQIPAHGPLEMDRGTLEHAEIPVAAFSHERAEGFVTFDSTVTNISDIISELDRRTGYGATVREEEESG